MMAGQIKKDHSQSDRNSFNFIIQKIESLFELIDKSKMFGEMQ